MTTSTLTIIKKTWQLSFSLSLSRLFNVLTSFFGIIMLARVGKTELAASALITSTQATLFLIAISFLFSIGVVVGHAFGAKNNEEVGSTLQQGWLLATIVVIPIMILQWNVGPILLACGQSPKLVHVISDYFKIYTFAMPAFLWMIVCQQFVLAVNKQRFVIFVSCLSLLYTTALAYAFIYGRFGAPRLGVNGLAWAYALQGWVSFFIYLAYCAWHPTFKQFELFRWRLVKSFYLLKKLFAIGWPISLQVAGDLLSFSAVTIMIGWLGASALATQQIITQYFILLVVPVFALSQASGILVGQARGAKQYSELNRYSHVTLFIGLSFCSLVTIAFVFFPQTLINLYLGQHESLSPHMLHVGEIVLIMTGLRLLFDAVMEIKTGSLRGLYDTKFAMLVGLTSTWILNVPLGYFFGIDLGYGLIGFTAGGVIAMIFGASVIYWRWLTKHKEFVTNKS